MRSFKHLIDAALRVASVMFETPDVLYLLSEVPNEFYE